MIHWLANVIVEVEIRETRTHQRLAESVLEPADAAAFCIREYEI